MNMENLATEFNGSLAECMNPGQYFDIDIKAIDNPECIHVRLAADKLNKNPNADIVLDIELKFEENLLTAKSRTGGIWGDLLQTECPTPKLREGNIKILIKILERQYKISINGETTLYFNCLYIMKDQINAIQIGGDVKLITRVDHRQTFPSVWPPPAFIDHLTRPLYFSNDIPIKFKPGHLMVVTGRPFGAPGSVYFHIKHSHNESQMFHMHVNFQTNMVYLSNLHLTKKDYISYTYENPETLPSNCFDFKKPFKVGLAMTETKFLIAVNGLYYHSYEYRDPENINYFESITRPYTNALSNLVGLKMICTRGMGVKVTALDHIHLHDPQCAHFEKYTKFDDCHCTIDQQQCAKNK